jgi:hypothetical protein
LAAGKTAPPAYWSWLTFAIRKAVARRCQAGLPLPARLAIDVPKKGCKSSDFGLYVKWKYRQNAAAKNPARADCRFQGNEPRHPPDTHKQWSA